MKRKDGSSGNTGGSSPTKKPKPTLVAKNTRSFSAQDVSTIGAPEPLPTMTGKAFFNHIAAMTRNNNESVNTKVIFKLQGAASEPEIMRSISASIGIKTHPTTGLTQGMMDSSAPSAYLGKSPAKSVLPENLSLERATLESRVIKKLSPRQRGDRGYKASAKVSAFPSLNLTSEQTAKSAPMGGIAIGSFLEDVTAARAVRLEDVGSAMRAKVMAAKWTMKREGNENAGQDFQSSMMSAFPQLGKKSLRIDQLRESGISGLNAHWISGGTDFTKQSQVDHIKQAHTDAYDAAIATFNHKFGQITATNKGGTWWSDQHDNILEIKEKAESTDLKRQKKAKKAFSALSESYMTRKLGRHGIKK